MDDQSHGRREGSWSMAAVSEFKRRKERRANVVYLIGKRISFPQRLFSFPSYLRNERDSNFSYLEIISPEMKYSEEKKRLEILMETRRACTVPFSPSVFETRGTRNGPRRRAIRVVSRVGGRRESRSKKKGKDSACLCRRRLR